MAKVFISYAHKDEDHKNALVEHISPLIRAGLIEEWNDRKLVPGTNWANEISENLQNSTIIIFLISSSFLNSDYCVEIEAKTALDMHMQGKARLIPVILRPTLWENSDLSSLQALPTDAKPVTKWDDADEAWLDVVQGLNSVLNTFKPADTMNIKKIQNSDLDVCISNNVDTWLNDTEITLTHRNVTKISLDQIFITPDIEIKNENRSDNLKVYHDACDILRKWDETLVVAEEQQGKTSLLKFHYKDQLMKGFLPLYLNGGDIKKSNIEELITKQLIKQYNNLSYEDYIASNKAVLLLDNVDQIGLNSKFRDILLNGFNKIFVKKLYTSQIPYLLIVNEIKPILNFKKAEILGLGHKKREQLIQKWVSLGVEETIQEKDLYERCDDLKDRVNTVVKRNIVPSKVSIR